MGMGGENAAAFPFSTAASSPRFCSPVASRRIFSDVAEDITVSVQGQSFLLHKFPLISRCGRIRRMVADSKDPDLSHLDLGTTVPGGAYAFELAAKFCYLGSGNCTTTTTTFEITPSNAARLRCVAEFLEMTDAYHPDNLLARTEAFLTDVAFKSLDTALEVLRGCGDCDAAMQGLVDRCVDAVAMNACKEQLVSGLASLECDGGGKMVRVQQCQRRQCHREEEWWVEELAALRIDHYRRVVAAMRRAGVRPESIGASVVHYAQTWLKGGGIIGTTRHVWDSSGPLAASNNNQQSQRVVVETLIDLLATENITAAVTLSFLFGMLRMAIEADAALQYRIEVERRIGMQLEMAALDDLLIPASDAATSSMFDTDTVHRILVNFLQRIDEDDDDGSGELSPGELSGYDESDGMMKSPSHSSVLKVGRLLDGYLAEIAPDPYLKLQKFMALIELLPDYARIVDDGLYRAIDIYLKAHPSLTDSECKKLCKLIDCQKLSQDACSHAAQNDRLPLQMVVRVLYFEQLRLKSSFSSSAGDFSQRMTTGMCSGSGVPSSCVSPRDNYASLRRENRELKLEISRMRVRLSELEREQGLMKQQGVRGGDGRAGAGDHGRAFLASLSRGIGRITMLGGGPERRRKKGSHQQQQCSERGGGKSRRRHKTTSFAYD